MSADREHEGLSKSIDLVEVLGTIEDTPEEGPRPPLLDAAGQEFASIAGSLAGPAGVAATGEQVAPLAVSSGGLTAKVRIRSTPKPAARSARTGR